MPILAANTVAEVAPCKTSPSTHTSSPIERIESGWLDDSSLHTTLALDPSIGSINTREYAPESEHHLDITNPTMLTTDPLSIDFNREIGTLGGVEWPESINMALSRHAKTIAMSL
jgi:hypothetical protein